VTHPYLSTLLIADRQRELRRQADNWRLFRTSRLTAATRHSRSWHLQSPIARRPLATPCA
jgi:hypothetical protein